MSDDELVERVARAIAAFRGHPWPDCGRLERDYFTREARAAIAAVREWDALKASTWGEHLKDTVKDNPTAVSFSPTPPVPDEGLRADYDRSIHDSPNAMAWTEFFCKTVKECGLTIADLDEEYMVGWFANAMMAMHDHIKRQPAPTPEGKT